MSCRNILIWLPSPMGDAIMATAALRCIRNTFAGDKIFFLAGKTNADILSGCKFCDEWIILKDKNILKITDELKKYEFTDAILFKNSFSSALAVFLAGIKNRTGYARDGRGLFLTQKFYPERSSFFDYKPISAINYYLKIPEGLGADTTNKQIELSVNENDKKDVREKFADKIKADKPIVILVPGGAFGPSKMWAEENFAKTADFLIEKFSANVFVSVSPAKKEIEIAEKICSLAKHPIINLGKNPVSLGQLKALFSFADLVITNDTGPRHIAIALNRKLITMFGPNNPAWTANDYKDEVKIIGQAPCVPCDKPICKKDKHFCMESITAEMICQAAEKILNNG
ncbi:MAG: lipopolysaccharide heptosyltransferase II [Planctomycetes bacterium GWF2_42_9]|nr:MAG: lipopolysaccharide heptosyltransferase II [Planctomycetes bacterium GWF2_42_9]HAL45444.1 lipopolysaccharide heptosyltransferase II [Phycisphaerales bacterium]